MMKRARNPQLAPGEELVITEPCVIQVYHGHRGKFRIVRRPLRQPKISEVVMAFQRVVRKNPKNL